MNWWKLAKLETFDERNHLNERIREFEAFTQQIAYIAQVASQTHSTARKLLKIIIEDKKMSSFDDIRNMLTEAYNVALDSPNKVQELCKASIIKLESKIRAMKVERRKFTHDELPKRLKGLQDEQ